VTNNRAALFDDIGGSASRCSGRHPAEHSLLQAAPRFVAGPCLTAAMLLSLPLWGAIGIVVLACLS
jgi:hypothetical protein